MNAERRKKISEAQDLMNKAKEILSDAANEEGEAYENLAENLQESEKGQRSLEYSEKLQEMADTLDEYVGEDFSE